MNKFLVGCLAVLAFASAAPAALILHVPDIVLQQSDSVQTGSFDGGGVIVIVTVVVAELSPDGSLTR